MDKTAVIYFDNVIYKAVGQDRNFAFDDKFYLSPDFLGRPNSTLRLNVVNYSALRNLSKSYPISLFHYDEVKDSLRELMGYQQIVINTVAAVRTVECVEALLEEIESCDSPPTLIFGTEYSWTNNIRTGNVSAELVDKIYNEHLILRHTARTDRHLYEPDYGHQSKVQEFEIGIDIASMPEPVVIRERKNILFVAAPEGRTTKNNDEIELICDELEYRGIPETYPIQILRPPYTAAQYWEALKSARFLIFTSLGETFSYVLNDALAMGVVALRRPELFSTRTSRFGVDAYWEVGTRYTSVEQAVDQIEILNGDDDRLSSESQRSASLTAKRFDSSVVEDNWLRLLTRASLNIGNLLLIDVGRIGGGVEQAWQIARDLDCAVVMAYMTRGLEADKVSSYSMPSRDRSQTLIPYCYVESNSGVRHIGPNAKPGKVAEGISTATVTDYMRLVVRTNSIRKIYVDSRIDDAHLSDSLDALKYLEGGVLRPVATQAVHVEI